MLDIPSYTSFRRIRADVVTICAACVLVLSFEPPSQLQDVQMMQQGTIEVLTSSKSSHDARNNFRVYAVFSVLLENSQSEYNSSIALYKG